MEWQRDVVFADDITQKVHLSQYPGGAAGEDYSQIERGGNTRCGSGTTPAVDRYMWVYVPLLGFQVPRCSGCARGIYELSIPTAIKVKDRNYSICSI